MTTIIKLDLGAEIDVRLRAVSDDDNLAAKLWPTLVRRLGGSSGTIDVIAANIFMEVQRYCATVPREQELLAVTHIRKIVTAVVGKHGDAVYNHMNNCGMTNIMPQ